jgi:hypothetical protein
MSSIKGPAIGHRFFRTSAPGQDTIGRQIDRIIDSMAPATPCACGSCGRFGPQTCATVHGAREVCVRRSTAASAIAEISVEMVEYLIGL